MPVAMVPPRVLVIENPNAEYLRALDALRTVTTIIVSNQLESLVEEAPRADVILAGYLKVDLLPAVFPKAARVRWVHSLRAGVEKVLFPELIASPVTFTNARGAYKRQLADFVLAAVLFFAKDLRRMIRNQEACVWAPFDPEDVEGKVMGIVGYGEIGRACAERARQFGMRILGLRRRPGLSQGDTLVEKMFGPNQLHEMLPACDYVLLAAPNTTATRHLIGQSEIDSTKPDAVLINVGRGSLVDEEALTRALEGNRIRGAALDVFETEPLPSGHPFYRLKNLLLAPHCADQVPLWRERAVEGFVQNFERFCRGEALENVVDKSTGY
jgi:phosphoglycerate dehydrogenase-like enzyme